MEALAGIIAGTITYIYYYRKFLKIKRLTYKIINEIMDIDISRRMDKIENKVDGIESKLHDLEVTLKVSLAKLQGKVARNASVVTAITMIAVLIVKEFIFK